MKRRVLDPLRRLPFMLPIRSFLYPIKIKTLAALGYLPVRATTRLPEVPVKLPNCSTGVQRSGNLYLNYILTIRPKRPLVVVFSAIDPVPGRCKASYYSLHQRLNASVLHIVDNVGSHGSYFLANHGAMQTLDAVATLIRNIASKFKIPSDGIFLVGTSKGGSEALMAALALGTGKVIAGEPQIRLGTFLFTPGWESVPSLVSIQQVLTGRSNVEDKAHLNKLIPSLIKSRIHDFKGSAEILYGKRARYLENHLFLLPDIFRLSGTENALSLVEVESQSHAQIAEPFQERLEMLVGLLPNAPPRRKPSDTEIGASKT